LARLPMAPWQRLDEHFPWNASSSGFETKPLYLLGPTGRSLYNNCANNGMAAMGHAHKAEDSSCNKRIIALAHHHTALQSLLAKETLKVRLNCGNFIAAVQKRVSQ